MIRRIVHTAIDNPVLLHIVFWVVCLMGLLAAWQMPKEEFPQVATDRVVVVVPYPGASPAVIEDRVVREVETALETVEGVKHVYADALEGRTILTVEFVRGTDADEARDEAARAIDALDLPEDTLSPRVSVARLRIPLTHIALLGDTRQRALAEDLADEITDLDGVSEVILDGYDERVIRVEGVPRHLAARGLSAEDLRRAIELAGLGAPGGTLEVQGQEVLVRTVDGVLTPEQIAEVPLRVGPGAHLTVGDVATVVSRFEPPGITHRVNGQPAIVMRVMRTDDADALKIVPGLYDWAEARDATLPEGLDLLAYDDSARMVRARVSVLASNGLLGALLVAAVLVVFIGRRNALLVVWGMPVAYLGAVAAMHLSGTTINVVSTFGLLLVTGIIVDDAVVIVENVQRHLEMGKDRVAAAIDGTSEVFGAVFAATLTTCFAFAPLLMLEGTVGRVMRIVPTVVILSLVASLVEAFFVLPGHLGHHAEERADAPENLPTRVLKRAYRPMVQWVTAPRHRLVALAGLVAFLVGALSLTGLMKTTLTTPGNPVFAFLNVDLPPGTDPRETRAMVRELEDKVAHEAEGLAIYAAGRVGEQFSPQGLPVWGARYGQLKVGFHNRPEVLEQVPGWLDDMGVWLDAHPAVASWGVESVTGGPPSGKPIDVRVRSRVAGEVLPVVDALVAHLEARPGVSGVRSEAEQGAVTFEVDVDGARAARFGLSEGQVAGAVRSAIEGALALELTVAERSTEVRVSSADPTDLTALRDLAVVLPDGRAPRLRQLASVRRVEGVERIQRVDGQRSVRVFADLDPFVTSSEEERQALEAAFADLGERFPSATLFYGGELADAAESFSQLPSAAFLAVVLIYGVLAIQFRSFLQPFIILAAIPLGGAGVILGLFLLQMDLSLIAMIGAVGLAGIVVNDSLVLVDFINRSRRAGRSVEEAVVEASLTRLRPILITTVTTVFGLLPLALGIAGEEPLLAPMAVAVSFGLSFATGLTLVAVPVLYLLLDDLGSRLASLAGR